MKPLRPPASIVAVVVLLLVACTDDGGGREATRGTGTAVTAPSPETPRAFPPPRDVDAGDPLPRIRLRPVARLEQPLALAVTPDGRAYVAEKTGRVRALDGGDVLLDLSDDVSTGSEQGLLGIAFGSDGSLFVNYTDRAGDTRIVRFDSTGGGRRELLKVDQPYSNHNGGHLAFGPDGMLYVGLGDGGAGGDPMGNAQRLSTRLGKILRLDPRPSGSGPFTVPPDNPFVGRDGADPLVWALGLRNPWRFSFDAGGALWVADVGQGDWEEVTVIPAGRSGANLGWDRLEGTHRFEGAPPPGHVAPVHEFGHDGGACAVTGGYRSRDPDLPELTGAYLFGDFCDGQLRVLRRDGDGWAADRLGVEVPQLSSFGEGPRGELYVLSLGGTVSRIELA